MICNPAVHPVSVALRLQLHLTDGKSLLGINSVRSVSKSARFIAALTIQSSLNDNQPADYK